MFSALHASLPQRSLLRSAPLTPRNALIPQCDISVHSGEELGAGRLGSVAGASWLEQPCAIKRIIPSSEERNNPGVGKRLEKEVEELIPHLCHPNLLPLYGICEQPDGALYLVFKLAVRGSLSARLRARRGVGLPMGELLHVAKGIASALVYLHDKRPAIVYGQLRPGNVLLSGDGNPMLDAEFGVIRDVIKLVTSQARLTAQKTTQGSFIIDASYVAPEQLLDFSRGGSDAAAAAEHGAAASGDEASIRLACAADVYSLAMVVLEMATGNCPHQNRREAELLAALLSEGRPPEVPDTVAPPLAAFVRACLETRPEARPTSRIALKMLAKIEREYLATVAAAAAAAAGEAAIAGGGPPPVADAAPTPSPVAAGATSPAAAPASTASALRGLFARP